MAHVSARGIISNKLRYTASFPNLYYNLLTKIIIKYRLNSYLRLRIFTPLIIYSVISFFFAMLNLPWQVHFDAHFSNKAKGFFCSYALFLVGMSALGLVTEVFATFPKFLPFMAYLLVCLIISNVSVAAVPVDLQVWLFKYYPAMVFYHINRGLRLVFLFSSTYIYT